MSCFNVNVEMTEAEILQRIKFLLPENQLKNKINHRIAKAKKSADICWCGQRIKRTLDIKFIDYFTLLGDYRNGLDR